MIKKVLTVKDERLRKTSIEVKSVDKKILELAKDLKDTLQAQKDPEGVGLAAPQIGKNLRVFLLTHEGETRIVVNPKIISASKEKGLSKKSKKGRKGDILEGCLSLPHYYGPLNRSKKIKIEYLNELGIKITEEFTGFLAQIVQHEIDHLNGILFIDRILEQKTKLYHVQNDEWEEVEI